MVNEAQVTAARFLPYPQMSDAVDRSPAYPAQMADELFRKRQKEANSYAAQEAAKLANMHRLRAERLAREAATPPETAEAAKPKARKKR